MNLAIPLELSSIDNGQSIHGPSPLLITDFVENMNRSLIMLIVWKEV